MSGLVFRDLDGEKVVYSGSQFDGLENDGSKHLCVRTGIGDSGIKKYGLTSAPLNDRYSKMKMRISAGEERRLAYIAQKYSKSVSRTSLDAKTFTKTELYTSSTTLVTNEKTFSTTKSTISNRTSTDRITKSSRLTLSTFPAYVPYSPVFHADNAEYKFPFSVSYLSVVGALSVSSGSETHSSSFYTLSSLTTSRSAGKVTLTMTRKWRSTRTGDTDRKKNVTDSYSYSKSFVAAQYWLRTTYDYTYAQSSSSKTTFTTSRATIISQASRSSLITGTATRASQYTSSEIITISSSFLTNNVNL